MSAPSAAPPHPAGPEPSRLVSVPYSTLRLFGRETREAPMTDLAGQRKRITGTLYSAVLSDVMDSVGLMNQALRSFVRPLDDVLVLFGRARTGLYMPRYQVAP